MGVNKIRKLEILTGTGQNALEITTTIKQFTSGTGVIC
jgi:hypothetical protein